jgi:hypothetical protein
MASGRPDKVQVAVAGEIVELTWSERETLLARLRLLDGFETIVNAFEAVGASGPVGLDVEQREGLRVLLELWGVRVMPDGLSRLLVALVRADKGGRAK